MSEETHDASLSNVETKDLAEKPSEDTKGVADRTPETAKNGVAGSDGINEDLHTNGISEHAEPLKGNTSEKHAGPRNETQDTEDAEMDDAQIPAPAPAPANGTPAPSKRASVGGSSKKKSSAIPEHKSKKLNKKKSKPLTILNAQPGQYYIARMKGHPPWPSIICDEDMLPQNLLNSRPVTAQLPDGSFKKPEYADGGKRAYERTYPIMFLHTNEFAWIPNTELAPLDVESDAVKNPVEKGKSKTLLQAYKKAADNEGLDHFKGMLSDHQKALEADLQEREERAAKKAKKASRKSEVAVEDEDEMDIDDEAVAEKPKSKKRKKAEDSEDLEEKPAKTPKTATKLKLSTPKTPAAEPSTKKKASKPKAAKATKSGSEDDAATPKAEKVLSEQELKDMKEKKGKKVLYFRHKLQRGFLSRDTAPKEDEMKAMSDYLGELEILPDLEGSIIRTTKIHKVLKAMIKLPSIPLDHDFHFKTRSVNLLGKWNEILSADNSAGASGDKDEEGKGEDTTQDVAPTTNGAGGSVEGRAKEAEAGEDAAPEDETDAKLKNKIGTTVEGEEEAEQPEKDTTEPATSAKDETDAPAIDSAPGEAYKPEVTSEATA